MTASNCLLSALVLATATISGATTLYWDADGDASNNALDGTGLGGAGAWTTSGCWWDGASASNQDWVDGSEAVFAGTTGTVTVASAVTCSLRFDAAGYVVQANNKLTVTDAAGAAATLNGKPVDFENEVDVAWPGKVSGGSGTSFEKGGAGALSIGLVSVEGTYAPVTIKKDAGTVTYTSPDAGGVNHTYFRMKENTRLDVGARTINFRLVEMDKTAVIESSRGGSIACSSQYDNKSVSGTLRGNLSI